MRQQHHDMVLRDEQHAVTPYALPGGVAPHARQDGEFNPARALLRHGWIVVIFALLGLGGAYLYLQRATPKYRSYAKIYIEQSGPRVFNEPARAVQRASYLYTQCEVMRSAPILSLVAEAPGLSELRTFEKYKGNTAYFLRERLVAEVGRKDDIITVMIESKYPEDAARIVNEVVAAYIKYQTLEKRTSASDQLKVLLDNKAKADAEIATLREGMYAFQQKHPQLTLNHVVNQELQTIANRLVEAEIAAMDARARYAGAHPTRLAVERTEQDLRRRYDEALLKTTAINLLTSDYDRMVGELALQQSRAQQSEDRVREAQLRKDAEEVVNTVTILEAAEPATKPSKPRPLQTYGMALAMGVILGGGLALLRERLDGRMRSVEEIQTVIGLPVLGVVPGMSGRKTAVARAMTVHLDPRSVVAESYRTIRTAVYFGVGADQCKTMLITSPEPGEGKTTSASNLAIAIAQTGRRVLLLDADFRKPTQHKNLEVKHSSGLSSVLAGREPLTKAMQHTGVDGLDILPCGPIPANPSEILNSREFGELIESLSEKYDHIIFDSPPVNAVTDARILGAVCDATILVVRADKSTRKSAEHARNALLAVGARILGVIVNDAPHRKGYDVYGGSYYGQAETVIRTTEAPDRTRPRRSLPKPAMDMAE